MKIPAECFDHFFAPLVGSEEARLSTQETLTAAVTNPTGDLQYIKNPYERLAESYRQSAKKAAQIAMNKHFGNRQPDDVENMLKTLNRNANIGIGVTIGALKGLENIYKKQRLEPQHLDTVRENVGYTVRFAYSLAFSDTPTVNKNVAGFRYGVDPNSLQGKATIGFKKLFARNPLTAFHSNAFDVTYQDDQLLVAPRYHEVQRVKGRMCPATISKIEVREEKRGALLTLLHDIGNVAAREIYPSSVEIIPRPIDYSERQASPLAVDVSHLDRHIEYS